MMHKTCHVNLKRPLCGLKFHGATVAEKPMMVKEAFCDRGQPFFNTRQALFDEMAGKDAHSIACRTSPAFSSPN